MAISFPKRNIPLPDVGGSVSNNASQTTAPVPWKAQSDTMFPPISIDGERWDKIFPYRFLVVEAQPNGGYRQVIDSGSSQSVELVKNVSKTSTILGFNKASTASKWEYHLPITPQQLSISTPYAISNNSTLKGITEEHNGVKYKIINMSGSFGIWPSRPTRATDPTTFTQSLASGSVAAFSGLNNTISALVGAVKETKIDSLEAFETGYAKALLLDQFLEQYAEAKKNPNNSGWRLVLDIPKQNQSFLVTPVQFSYSQAADSPNEFKFNLQLKAFKRISLNEGEVENESQSSISVSNLQRVIFAIAQARRVLGDSLSLVKAVRSDFQAPFNALRQASLFYKDLAGLAVSVIDLPNQIIKDIKSTISDSLKNVESGNNAFTKAKDKAKISQFSFLSASSEGLSIDAIGNNQAGPQGSNSLKTSPTNTFFENPEESFDILNSLDISSLSITPSQQDAIDSEIFANQLLTADDLRKQREIVLETATQIANNFGASTDLYSRLYETSAPYERIQDMTIDELVVLKALYDAVQAMDVVTATKEIDDVRIQNAYDFVRDVAAESNVPFNGSVSKILVPVPFGLNIEQIALRYLGDTDRWLEIATINALKAPYIDENGFFKPLLSNADGRQFNIESSENLYVNQKITIMSLNQPPTQRRITNIEKISDTNYLISVDGLDNLDVYTTAAQAKIQAFLSGTVNSQTQIFIPSDEVAPDDIRSKSVPVAAQDALTGLSKIDWLLTEDGDVAIDSFGDVRLAFGIANLIQALKMKFSVSVGQLLKHPRFGNGVEIGSSTADLQLKELYTQVRETVISDPRFSDIAKLEITLEGSVLTFNLMVTVAQNRGILPISFSVSA